MIIHYLSSDAMKEAQTRNSVLIGKLWHSRYGLNNFDGEIGVKRPIAQEKLEYVFDRVELHNLDRIRIVANTRKRNMRDPDLLLYIERGIEKQGA
jgi:hypothetical protein